MVKFRGSDMLYGCIQVNNDCNTDTIGQFIIQ